MEAFCCQGNKTKGQITITLAILNCPYPSIICTKLESHTASVVLEEMSFKKNPFFLNLMLPWQPNKMANGHKTHKLVDIHPMITTAKYGSHHFTSYGENAI